MRYTLEWYVSGEPFYTPPGELSAAVSDAVESVSGVRPKLTTGGGTSDGRFIAPMGAQVVELGVINASIHKVNECVRVEDIDALHRMYFNVLREPLGLRSSRKGPGRQVLPSTGGPRPASQARGSAS